MTTYEQRAATLQELRRHKMARSAHAYVRGSTESFYNWLGESGHRIPAGPPIWICGDCHLGNLGPLADRKGRVSVQIRDLDQTVIGNPAHDLIRLGLSLASAARGSDLPGSTTARIIERLTQGYEEGVGGDFSHADRDSRPRTIQRLLANSVRRRWRHLAEERLQSVEPVLPMGKRFWPLEADERGALESVFALPDVLAKIAALQDRADVGSLEIVDAAYWIKGCSSLGRRRYAVMVRVGKGKSAQMCLIDLKEGVPAAAPSAPGAAMPADDSLRVVTGAKALSPALGDRMIPVRFLETSLVLRELMPQDLKIEVNRLTCEEAEVLAGYLAGVVGHAHARQMDQTTRDRWLAELSRARSSQLDAPNWLWASVVDLLSIHEAAYLNHCRDMVTATARAS